MRHPKTGRSAGRQTVVRYIRAFKDSEELVAESMPFNAIDPQHGGVRSQATPFTVLLYRYSGQTDILVGIPAAGRTQIETEPLIGLFVNTVVLRTDLSGNPRFTTLLTQVRDVMLEALAIQDVPFERIVQELQPVRSLSYNPLFQVMFATFQEPVRCRSFGDLVVTPYVVNTATSRFDLSAALIEGADGRWWMKLEYDTALFDYDRITKMLGHYERLLRSIADQTT